MNVSVYCLVDPRTNCPFYVGITNGKLSTRLSGHILEAKSYVKHPPYHNNTIAAHKHRLIVELITLGKKPIICLLLVIPRIAVNHYERFFYDTLIKQGYSLFQLSSAFRYYESRANSRFNRPEYRQYKEIRKYNHISYKNMLIIIW